MKKNTDGREGKWGGRAGPQGVEIYSLDQTNGSPQKTKIGVGNLLHSNCQDGKSRGTLEQASETPAAGKLGQQVNTSCSWLTVIISQSEYFVIRIMP